MNNHLSSEAPAKQLLTTDPKKKEQTKDQLVKAIGNSNDVLVRATTVFPLTLFPDTITIDRTKLTIVHRDLFNSGEVVSISIEDLLNVRATVGPFFGNVIISTRFFNPNKPYKVQNFWRRDALKIKRIGQGYIIARQKKIDCSALSSKELARTLDELGKVDDPEKV
jgi:hypothetical protein